MSFAIQPIGARPYNSLSKNNSLKTKQNSDVSFGTLLPTREDKILAGLGGAGGIVAIAGILNKLGIESFTTFEFPVVVTTLCAFLPLIAGLGIFGSKKNPA